MGSSDLRPPLSTPLVWADATSTHLYTLNLCLGICQGHLIAKTLFLYISIQMESPRTSP